MDRRDDSDELDDEPIRSPKKNNTVLIVVLCVAGALVLVCGVGGLMAIRFLGQVGDAARRKQQEVGNGIQVGGPVKMVKLGEAVSIGDLVVTVLHARDQIGAYTHGGRLRYTPEYYSVYISLKNMNPNRVIEIGSQTDRAVMTDDVGNTYRPVVYKDGFGNPADVEHQIMTGTALRLRSDEKEHTSDFVMFERPVPGASKVTIRLSATIYGGEGWLEVDADPKSR